MDSERIHVPPKYDRLLPMTIRVTPQTFELIEQWCKDRNRSRNDIVNIMLEQRLKRAVIAKREKGAAMPKHNRSVAMTIRVSQDTHDLIQETCAKYGRTRNDVVNIVLEQGLRG